MNLFSLDQTGRIARLGSLLALVAITACSSGTTSMAMPMPPNDDPGAEIRARAMASIPDPDPRVGLSPGLFDAGEAMWNMRKVSSTPPPSDFLGVTNSDLGFQGDYAFQGNYNGYQVWDLSTPERPELEQAYLCPASQSDVSVYQNLLFVSGEGMGGRLDCGSEGIQEAVSHDRLRGIRIFDVSDLANPVNVGNVQTCRGSHTHTLLVDPDDQDNVYVYVSGSAPVRPSAELPGCSSMPLDEDPNSALFRIEVIQVPLDDPGSAEIVSSPRIFHDLVAPPTHGLAPDDLLQIEEARARGQFVVEIFGQVAALPPQMTSPMLDSIVSSRGGTGTPTAADSMQLREALPDMIRAMIGAPDDDDTDGPRPGPTQCHDITVYPEIDLAGGACEGYGLLLDITDPANPVRLAAVSDANFSYWHSATFNNDGTQLLFSDEWGGGGGPKCRASDPPEWGADAIFTVEGGDLVFQSYFKMLAPQTSLENCVAHNGSMIPIPGRDIMVQAWYQGGINLVDWTDPANPIEIGFHDRGPVDGSQMGNAGSWSVYWYNGMIVSSEIARGLDIFELVESEFLTQNEIDAANSVHLDYLNAQGQPHFVWPPTFALARAYVDQLERDSAVGSAYIERLRTALSGAEQSSGRARRTALTELGTMVANDADDADDPEKMGLLADALRRLAAAT